MPQMRGREIEADYNAVSQYLVGKPFGAQTDSAANIQRRFVI